VMIDDFAFLKETLTPFRVTLGEQLQSLGDNPFAMCTLAPLRVKNDVEFNGVTYEGYNDTYAISDTVKVENGGLYSKIATGWELIAYAGTETANVKLAADTVRITAYAFAGTDVKMVTLPYTVGSIGHKAFYGCKALDAVVFSSYDSPVLEEEFDSAYYESFEHIPGTGDFGTYEDYDGTQVQINGMGLLPYYMWNATDGMYGTVFYGANFVDYIGYVSDKLTMIRPVNGEGYDSYTLGQYFDLTIDGAQAADDTALAAIAAINAIPERVTFADKPLVEAARAAYSKVATLEQQAQVTNYATLISAEQKIAALDPSNQPGTEETPVAEETGGGFGWIIALSVILVLAGGSITAVLLRDRKLARKKASDAQEASEDAPVAVEELTEDAPADTEEQ